VGGAFRKAQRSIFFQSLSARSNVGAPPYNYIRAGPKHPKITLPYNNVDTASACINYSLTRRSYSPNKRVWHLIW
jgi:hypothetical protein